MDGNYKWYSMTADEVLGKLNTSKYGLTEEEAHKRLIKYGNNELPRKKTESFIKIFVRQIIDPMEILLIIAMIISFLINEIIDGIAILFIILVDLLMGTFQEWKAEKTAESLSNLIKVMVKVLRDNEEIEIESTNLVLGDIVILESGNKVSADLRILESKNLQIDESALTGESVSINKNSDICNEMTILANRSNMAYAGTNVISGRGLAVVVSVGLNSELGKIADQVVNSKEEKSPLSIRISQFTKQIAFLVISIAIIIAIILLFKGKNLNEIVLSVIALAVSIMPEGLGLALTMALTIASNRMSKKNVIAKKLHSVESLGSCTVIASDKTGTLTVNEQTAKLIVLPNSHSLYIEGSGYNDYGEIISDSETDFDSAKIIAKMGYINNEAKLEKEDNKFISFGDSIDIAFLALYKKFKIEDNKYQILSMMPYESENKYSAVFFKEDSKQYCTVKGSLEVVLSMCQDMLVDGKIIPLDKNLINSQNERLAKNGYRVIALAKKEIDKSANYNDNDLNKMCFLGLVAFIDPVRTEVRGAINECRSAGIKVLMITGDHPLTAFSIAKDLKIVSDYSEVTTGNEVDEYLNLGKKKFDKFISEKKVFTRVTPLNKLQIINSLKRQGEFVAVTGDGINDAPAIKSANIGISMGSGTDVAKETASLIILDDNFNSIVSGIKEGRNAYSNIRKVSYMLLSCGIAEVLFFILSIISNLPMPLIAVQLLWLNIVTDGLQDFALSFEKAEPDIMKQKPRSPKETIFNKELLYEVLLAGFTIGLVVFITWVFLLKCLKMDIPTARGYIMVLMVFMQNMHVLNCRSERDTTFKISLKSNLWIVFAILSAIFLQIIVSEIDIFSNLLQTSKVPIIHMIPLLCLSSIIIIVMETYKYLKYHYKRGI